MHGLELLQEAKPLQQQLEQQDDELEGAAAAADEAQCTGRRRANQQQANNSEPQWLTEQQAAEQQVIVHVAQHLSQAMREHRLLWHVASSEQPSTAMHLRSSAGICMCLKAWIM